MRGQNIMQHMDGRIKEWLGMKGKSHRVSGVRNDRRTNSETLIIGSHRIKFIITRLIFELAFFLFVAQANSVYVRCSSCFIHWTYVRGVFFFCSIFRIRIKFVRVGSEKKKISRNLYNKHGCLAAATATHTSEGIQVNRTNTCIFSLGRRCDFSFASFSVCCLAVCCVPCVSINQTKV